MQAACHQCHPCHPSTTVEHHYATPCRAGQKGCQAGLPGLTAQPLTSLPPHTRLCRPVGPRRAGASREGSYLVDFYREQKMPVRPVSPCLYFNPLMPHSNQHEPSCTSPALCSGAPGPLICAHTWGCLTANSTLPSMGPQASPPAPHQQRSFHVTRPHTCPDSSPAPPLVRHRAQKQTHPSPSQPCCANSQPFLSA